LGQGETLIFSYIAGVDGLWARSLRAKISGGWVPKIRQE